MTTVKRTTVKRLLGYNDVGAHYTNRDGAVVAAHNGVSMIVPDVADGADALSVLGVACPRMGAQDLGNLVKETRAILPRLRANAPVRCGMPVDTYLAARARERWLATHATAYADVRALETKLAALNGVPLLDFHDQVRPALRRDRVATRKLLVEAKAKLRALGKAPKGTDAFAVLLGDSAFDLRVIETALRGLGVKSGELYYDPDDALSQALIHTSKGVAFVMPFRKEPA